MVGHVEGPRPLHGRYHYVFDAHPMAVRDINARLDRKRMAGSDRRRVAGDHIGIFVRLEADPVARAVHEVLAETSFVDHPARSPVHAAAELADLWTAITPAACALATTPYSFASSRDGSPVKTVRVMSEQ